MSFFDDETYNWEDLDGDSTQTLKYERIKHETKSAWLIEFEMIDLESVEEWMPKSQCALLGNNRIEVQQWLIDEKGLEGYVA